MLLVSLLIFTICCYLHAVPLNSMCLRLAINVLLFKLLIEYVHIEYHNVCSLGTHNLSYIHIINLKELNVFISLSIF